MGDRLARGRQVILFLNRRGYSQFILCRDCGYVARCPNCAVSLAFHAAWSALRCHHCDYSRSAPSICPQCKGTRIKGFGVGTEKVEEEALKFFPDARIARLDRDTTARKGAHGNILGAFRRGEADILIGTQMVAKGLDFPNVTLVGVISADTSINMPDFRAAERTFQLLTQVAGRSGRGEEPGEVFIQTFGPDHYALQMTRTQDYRGFYDKEIEFRRELTYPPFSRLANLICTDEDSRAVRERAYALAAACKEVVPEEIEVIGPAAAPLAKLKTLYRWHVVLRAPVGAPLPGLIRDALSRLEPADRRRVTVDVDPLNMT
jgi:primosomal protein N' (replication factor Y)